MAESNRRNLPGPLADPERDAEPSQRDDPARRSGPADVAAGWNRGHWRAPRDYGAQALAAGQGGARDAHGPAASGGIETPPPARYQYDLQAPQRNLEDGEQLVGGHGFSGLARQALSERRGPKGYRRSDQRIREDLCEALIATTHLDASEVSVDVSEAQVRLEGTVPERHMKHTIEDIAAGVPGVLDVENRIRVVRGGGNP